MEGMLEVTNVDLVKMAQVVYELSSLQGLGFLHAKSGGLSEVDAKKIVEREEPLGRIALSMDYIHGLDF